MTESTNRELMKAVERVVRPVRASLARKRRMREELMAHVTALLDEEAPRPNAEGDALSRAVRRLGDPAELTVQLQQSVPAGDAMARFVDRLWLDSLRRPVLSLAKRNAKVAALLTLLAFSTPVLLSLLAFATPVPPFVRERQRPLAQSLIEVFVAIGWFTLLLSALTFVVTVVENGLRQAAFGASTRCLGLAVLIGVARYLVIPATAFLAFCLLEETWESAFTGGVSDTGWVAAAAGFALLAPWVLYRVAVRQAEELRYREEWGALDVPG
jgi:hypothetical protein